MDFRARRLDDDGLRRFFGDQAATWPLARWDQRRLELAALYFSPSLAVARSRWQAAEAAVATAGEIPNPTVNLAPQYVSNATAGMPAWVVASSLAQIIETAGKRGFRVARAHYQVEGARLEMLNAAWETVGAVRSGLLDIEAAQNRVAALDRLVAAQSALSDIAEKRLAAGLGSRLELTAARTSHDRAVLDRQASLGAVADARNQLAQAVGVSAEAIPLDRLSTQQDSGGLDRDFEKRVREEAILDRADLLASLAEYGAAETTLQLEVARQYPDIEIGPGYEYDQGENKWGLSLSFALPIFNQNQGAIGEAMAQRRQAADAFLAVQARVIGEVDRTVAAYRSAEQAFVTADALYHRQAAQSRAQQALFDRGETDRTDILASKAELANAELAKADAAAALAKARLELERASQRSMDGFDPAPWVIRERD